MVALGAVLILQKFVILVLEDSIAERKSDDALEQNEEAVDRQEKSTDGNTDSRANATSHKYRSVIVHNGKNIRHNNKEFFVDGKFFHSLEEAQKHIDENVL